MIGACCTVLFLLGDCILRPFFLAAGLLLLQLGTKFFATHELGMMSLLIIGRKFGYCYGGFSSSKLKTNLVFESSLVPS